MKRLYYLALLLTATFTACDKEDEQQVDSKCIREQIAKFKASPLLCKTEANITGGSVQEYYFQDKLVYVFNVGNCITDGAAGVYDAECNVLGQLGGFTGNTKINGQSFSTAEFRRTIWKN